MTHYDSRAAGIVGHYPLACRFNCLPGFLVASTPTAAPTAEPMMPPPTAPAAAPTAPPSTVPITAPPATPTEPPTVAPIPVPIGLHPLTKLLGLV